MPKFTLCSVSGCTKRADKRGMCAMHYRRWKLYGDPNERRRTEKGAPIKFIMEIALCFAGNDCLIWPWFKDENGRGNIWHNGRMVKVPRFVCTLAHGEPPTPKHDAAHECGNGHLGCINPHHLSWKTKAENEADKIRHGTLICGEDFFNAKITEDQARQILASNESAYVLAERFGINRRTVQDIWNRKTWKHLSVAL